MASPYRRDNALWYSAKCNDSKQQTKIRNCWPIWKKISSMQAMPLAPAMDFVPLRAQWILMWANIYMSFAKITIVLLLINWASYRPTISRKFRAD